MDSSIALVLVMGAMAFGMISRNAAATTIVTGQNGWDGNNVIYLTEGVSSTSPYIIQGQSKPANQPGSGNSYNIANAVNVAVGQDPGTNDSYWEFSEYYYGGGSNPYLEIHVPVVAGGAGQQYYAPYGSPPVLDEVLHQQLSLSISNSPSSNTVLAIQNYYDSGINMTGSIPEGTTREQALVNEGIDALSKIPFYGYAIGSYQMENGLAAITGADAYLGSAGANGNVYQTFHTTGGGAASTVVGGWFDNVFDPQEIVFVDIPESEWTSYQPVLTITATNVVGDGFSCYGCLPVNGATASLTVNAVPAVTLTGTVYLLGKTYNNQIINLQATSGPDSGTIYQLKTSATGTYSFFARLGTSYSLSTTYTSSFGGTVTGSISKTTPNTATVATLDLTVPWITISGTVTDANTHLPIYYATVVINEPYPPGTPIDPTTNNAGQYSVTANLLGTYTFSVGHSGYNTASGSLPVSAWNQAYTMNFALTPTSGGGGGGGCILTGTQITLAGGGTRAVNKLQVGDRVLGYNATTSSWVQETVTSNGYSSVSHVLSINNGLLEVTLWDQPLYVRNGTWTGWVHDPQNLTVGEQIFVPRTGSWVSVTSLQILTGNFKVYDLRVTAPNDFVANGVLVGDKPIPV